MTPGTLAIWAAAVLATVALVSAIRWSRGREAAETTFRLAYHGMTAALALASVFLMIAILLHDFRYDYVVRYSSRDLPLLYLIAAFWGGQEGTFLLWALVSALMGYALFRKRSWEPATVMSFYVPTIGFMIGMMLEPLGLRTGGNPFRLSDPVPADGFGLNELLQDPWMATHPPAVFVGYAAMTIPGVLALVALFKREEERWLGAALRWTLFGFLSLGVGIVLGGFWAYKTLGWGGYWGWDPVENASLIPWIVGAALIHGLIVQRATGGLKRTNLLLAILGYWLVIYSTFLTRTGVLANFSVHSFAAERSFWDTPTNVMLLGILVAILAFGVFAIARRGRIAGAPIEPVVAWPAVLTVVIALFGISALLVFYGTTYPLPSSILGSPGTYDAAWYNRWNLPPYLLLLGLLGFAPFLGWLAKPPTDWARKAAVPVAVAAAGTLAVAWMGYRGATALVLLFAALLATTANVARLVSVARVGILLTGAAIAHLGFALMFVGIVASGRWGHGGEVKLPLGRPVETLGMTLTYRGHVEGSSPKDRWRVAVLRPGEDEVTLEVRLYNKGQDSQGRPQTMRFPAILREAGRDIYVSPLGLESGEEARGLELARGTPVEFGGARLTFVKFDGGGSDSHAMSVVAQVLVERGGESETVRLPLAVVDGELRGEPVTPKALGGTALTLERMSVEQGTIRVSTGGGSEPASETLIVDASTKPLMGVLWLGTLLVGVGCAVAMTRRYLELRAPAPSPRPATAGLATIGGPGVGTPRER